MKTVRYEKRQGMFNEGEIHTFDDATADQIVSLGYAKFVCGSVSAPDELAGMIVCALEPGHGGIHKSFEDIEASKPVAKPAVVEEVED
jgi:hypothetical protein